MARDTTPSKIILRNDNFSTETHEEIAEILKEEWDASQTFNNLADKYPEYSRTTIQEVYKQYFGVPEEIWNDGIEDTRTIAQIKRDHGRYLNYREARDSGELSLEEEEEELPETVEMTERELQYYQEGFRDGYQSGLEDANTK